MAESMQVSPCQSMQVSPYQSDDDEKELETELETKLENWFSIKITKPDIILSYVSQLIDTPSNLILNEINYQSSIAEIENNDTFGVTGSFGHAMHLSTNFTFIPEDDHTIFNYTMQNTASKFYSRTFEFVLDRVIKYNAGKDVSKYYLKSKHSLTILLEFIQDALYNCIKNSNDISVYIGLPSKWILYKTISKLDIDIIPESVQNILIPSITNFIDNTNTKSSVLLHGPRGIGKMKTIIGVASYFNMNITMVNLDHSHYSKIPLEVLFHNIPDRSIIVLQNLEELLYTSCGETMFGHITKRNLIKILNGSVIQNNSLIFITCSDMQKLDCLETVSIDTIIEMPRLSKESIQTIYNNHYTNEQFDDFYKLIKKNKKVTEHNLIQYFSETSDPLTNISLLNKKCIVETSVIYTS
jgi:hypothetical protein